MSGRGGGHSFGRLGSLGSAGSLDPALRNVLQSVQRAGSLAGASGSVLLPHAARALSAEEADAMRRLFAKRAAKPGQSGPPGTAERAADLDSAMHTESSEQGDSVAGEAALLAMLDEGWFTQPAKPAPGWRPASRASSLTSYHSASEAVEAPQPRLAPTTPLELPLGEPVSRVGSTTSTPTSAFVGWTTTAQPGAQRPAATAGAPVAPRAESTLGSLGWESPRSWGTASHLSDLQQAQLEAMDLAQLESLAAEAAKLQHRAALAMQFARQRMGPPSALLPPALAVPAAAAPAPETEEERDGIAKLTGFGSRGLLGQLVVLVAALLQLAMLLSLGLVGAMVAQAQRSMAHAAAAPARLAAQLWSLLLGLVLALSPMRL